MHAGSHGGIAQVCMQAATGIQLIFNAFVTHANVMTTGGRQLQLICVIAIRDLGWARF